MHIHGQTHADMHGGVEPTDAEIKDLLRQRGLRVTAPRLVVLQVLYSSDGHLSAEEIHEAVLARCPVVNMVTVYRTLESFEERGLAVRAVLDHKIMRWERGEYAHHHLVCRACGTVIELDDAPFQRLADDLAGAYGVHVDVRHLALHGLCAGCAARVAPSATST